MLLGDEGCCCPPPASGGGCRELGGSWAGSEGGHQDTAEGTEAEMPRTRRSRMSPRGVLGGPGLGSSGEGGQRFSLSMGPQEGTTALYRLEGEKKRARGGY